MSNMPLFPADDARADAEDRADEIAEHRRDWAVCWPEWEGPRVGGYCDVGACCVFSITHNRVGYYYCAPCRILSISDDGCTFEVEIEYDDEAPEMKGERLRLDITEVWAPVKRLIRERERNQHGEDQSENDRPAKNRRRKATGNAKAKPRRNAKT